MSAEEVAQDAPPTAHSFEVDFDEVDAFEDFLPSAVVLEASVTAAAAATGAGSEAVPVTPVEGVTTGLLGLGVVGGCGAGLLLPK